MWHCTEKSLCNDWLCCCLILHCSFSSHSCFYPYIPVFTSVVHATWICYLYIVTWLLLHAVYVTSPPFCCDFLQIGKTSQSSARKLWNVSPLVSKCVNRVNTVHVIAKINSNDQIYREPVSVANREQAKRKTPRRLFSTWPLSPRRWSHHKSSLLNKSCSRSR